MIDIAGSGEEGERPPVAMRGGWMIDPQSNLSIFVSRENPALPRRNDVASLRKR